MATEASGAWNTANVTKWRAAARAIVSRAIKRVCDGGVEGYRGDAVGGGSGCGKAAGAVVAFPPTTCSCSAAFVGNDAESSARVGAIDGAK